MGDMADDLMDQMENEFIERYQQFSEDLDNKIWRTNDNTEIKVAEMGDSHILNIINFLGREKDFMFREEWIKIFKEEIKKRGIKFQ